MLTTEEKSSLSRWVEFKKLRQDGQGYRRLFSNEKFELYLWYEFDHEHCMGFQFVYGPDDKKKAFSWSETEGFTHELVDGWDQKAYKGSPILLSLKEKVEASVLGEIETLMEDFDDPSSRLIRTKISDYALS